MNSNTEILPATEKQLQKRGRKHGSNDSVNVSIETLLEYLPTTAVIPVRRKWLEAMAELHNVTFVDNTPRKIVQIKETVLEEREVAAASDAVVRPRLEIQEEQL